MGELEGRTAPGIQQSLLLLQTNPSLPYKSDGVGEHLGFSQFKVKQRCAKMLSGPNHCVPGSRARASLHMGHYSLFTDETGLSVQLGQSFLPFPCSTPCPARVSCNQKCFCHSVAHWQVSDTGQHSPTAAFIAKGTQQQQQQQQPLFVQHLYL